MQASKPEEVEEFLATKGVSQFRMWIDNKPTYGEFSVEELRAAYGDNWEEKLTKEIRAAGGFVI